MPHGVSSKLRSAPRPSSLALVETFSDLSPGQLAELKQRLLTVPISRGQVPMCQGDAADALYIVASAASLWTWTVGELPKSAWGHRSTRSASSPTGFARRSSPRFATRSCSNCREADPVELTERHPAMLRPIPIAVTSRPPPCRYTRRFGRSSPLAFPVLSP